VTGTSFCDGCFAASQLVATPLFIRCVGVSYWTNTAVTCTVVGNTCENYT